MTGGEPQDRQARVNGTLYKQNLISENQPKVHVTFNRTGGSVEKVETVAAYRIRSWES